MRRFSEENINKIREAGKQFDCWVRSEMEKIDEGYKGLSGSEFTKKMIRDGYGVSSSCGELRVDKNGYTKVEMISKIRPITRIDYFMDDYFM